MSLRQLPESPNLEHLKNQSRTLLDQSLAADPDAIARFAAFGVTSPQPKLADALHVIAREYGFDTWPALKLHIETTSEDPLQALSAAIRANQAAAVREVLTRHPALRGSVLDEPLAGLSFDAQALIGAVIRDNREMVEALLDAGADINVRTRWWAGGFGVLDTASPTLAEYLISRGAVVDIHAAARLGKIDRVRELLAADPALVHARGGDGELPLHFAATVEIAELLLDHGAEINARDIDHESTAAQYMVCMRQLLEWRDPYRHDVARYLISRGAEADILMASALGDLALVERILNHDPDMIRVTVRERDFPKIDPRAGGCIYYFGFGITTTPHMLARQFGHTAVHELLVQRSPAWIRLINVAETGDEVGVKRILAEHPMLFRRLTDAAARRLIGTAVRNNARAVELLVSHGWPVAAKLENGQMALHYAAWHGNLAMVETLLRHGAPVNVFEMEHGGSPLGWTLHGSMNSWHRDKGDYPAVARALLAAGADIPKPEGPLEATDDVLQVLRQHNATPQ
ncbi:ankyrin repeat domain-containing protein [Silvibacterium sp.]|uniref:ankyrin repeat domain-containing protein n=1 Tax=Silvibacterium sp. TaxID=1964179 RepID=UPI0039E577ED